MLKDFLDNVKVEITLKPKQGLYHIFHIFVKRDDCTINICNSFILSTTNSKVSRSLSISSNIFFVKTNCHCKSQFVVLSNLPYLARKDKFFFKNKFKEFIKDETVT